MPASLCAALLLVSLLSACNGSTGGATGTSSGTAVVPTSPGAPPRSTEASEPPPQPHFREALDAHNALRAKHCAPPLRWSEELARYAQKWADSLAGRGCLFGHNPEGRFGENLSFFAPVDSQTPSDIARSWYREVELYDFDASGFSMKTGHFTQLIWRETQLMGCGVSHCNGGAIWVCNYDPPGNVEGLYQANVLAEGCR
jgi:uncharacterized protein YkwD